MNASFCSHLPAGSIELFPWSRHQPFSHSYPILSPRSFDPSPLDSTYTAHHHHSHSFTSFVSLPPNLYLISTLAFLSFPQTLFSSYSSYNNRLKICLLFFLSSIDFARSIVYGERVRETGRGREMK